MAPLFIPTKELAHRLSKCGTGLRNESTSFISTPRVRCSRTGLEEIGKPYGVFRGATFPQKLLSGRKALLRQCVIRPSGATSMAAKRPKKRLACSHSFGLSGQRDWELRERNPTSVNVGIFTVRCSSMCAFVLSLESR